MARRYDLGLEDRDRVARAFGGGLPRGSLVLVEGDHGAGKSVLCQRFCYGLCESGTPVTYVSQEETAASFVDQMRSLGYDPVDHLLRERLLFLHADVDTAEAIAEGAAAEERRELVRRLTRAETMWRGDVVVVDGFDAVLRNDPQFQRAAADGAEDDVVRNVVSFLRPLLADGTTAVLSVNPEALRERALRPLRDTSDVSLELTVEEAGGDVRRQVLVRKFANMGEQVEDSISFDVQANRGLTIVTRTVA